jgi:hypothetical protein
MKLLLIIAPSQADADRYIARRTVPPGTDWQWIVSRPIAVRWLERCRIRGVPVDPTWVFVSETAERSKAA